MQQSGVSDGEVARYEILATPQDPSRIIIPPFSLSYDGRDAATHMADIIQIGTSLGGIGRIYNSVAYAYIHGKVPARNVKPEIRTYAGPPLQGSLTYILLTSIVYDQIGGYSSIVKTYADAVIKQLIGAIFAKRSGQSAVAEELIKVIAQMAQHNADLANTAMGHVAASNNKAYALLDKLTDTNKAAMADMARPVGQTCSTVTHFKGQAAPIIVDEPTAVAMRSTEGLIVGNQTTYVGHVLGVDTATGSSRLRLEDGSELRCLITDPAIRTPNNVYTAALNSRSLVAVTAKPVYKGNQLVKLYISDGKAA